METSKQTKNLTINNLDELTIHEKHRLVISSLLPFIKTDKNGQKSRNVSNFNPQANFLAFHVQCMEKIKLTTEAGINLERMSELMINFLEEYGLYKEADGKPYFPFLNFTKSVLEKLEEWLSEEELGDFETNVLHRTLEATFEEAESQSIITRPFNPFR